MSSPRRIFIVEDDADGATSLALLLRAEGHRVHTSRSARGALHEIDSSRPEFALIDMGVPHMDGYALLATLRLRADLQGTKFIALTACAQDNHHPGESRTRASFDAYLTKPANAALLAATFRDVQNQPALAASR